jgi:NAD-dependent deacetylase
MDDHLISNVARRLAKCRRVVVLTGAGVSKESGIPTFREAQEGLWAQYDPMEMATEEGYLRNPALVWRWYDYRFGMVERAQPNPGHRAIAELERLVSKLTVVTQNIDGLHQVAGSTDVVELHGSIRRFKCLRARHTGFTRADFADQADVPPRCPRCGDLLRPDVVWFGELLPGEAINRAYDLAETCDAMLVVGTSGVVQPAASLPFIARRAGATVIDVNPDSDEIAGVAHIFLQGPGGAVLPALVAALRMANQGTLG